MRQHIAADLAGVVSPGRQTGIGPHAGRSSESRGIVEGRNDGHGGDRSDAGHRHQQSNSRMTPGDRADPAVERGDAGKDVAPGLHQSFEDRNEFRRDRQLASDDFLGPSFEPTNALGLTSRQMSSRQAPDLIFQPDPHSHQGVARRKQRPIDIGIVALDLHGLKPAGAHDLGEAAASWRSVLFGIIFSTPAAFAPAGRLGPRSRSPHCLSGEGRRCSASLTLPRGR